MRPKLIWESLQVLTPAECLERFGCTLTIRLPDDAVERLKSLAKSRGVSVNKLVERMAYEAVAAFDAESRFRALAAKGDRKTALAILKRLDRR